jgi:hypothetical protein
MVFSIKDLNAIVRNYDLRQMIARLYSFKVGDKKEHTHPLSNLLWYSGITHEKRFSYRDYRDASEFYNDIMKALTSLPKIPSAENPSAKIASAVIPTAEIPFSGFSSQNAPTMMMMHNDQESTTAESPTPIYATPSISTSGIPSLRMSSASHSTPFISNSSFGSNSFKWGGRKKTKRHIPKKRSMKKRK